MTYASLTNMIYTATSRRHSAFTGDSRPGSGYGPKSYPYPPRGFPPSPPLGSDAPLDSRSPISKTAPQFPPSSKPASGYYHETTPPLEADLQRQHYPHAPPSHGPLPHYPRQAPPAPTSQPASSYFPPSAAAMPQPQPAVAAPPPPHAPGLAQQRPLPQAFPPVNMPPQPPSAAISWQHHHYLHPASGQLFPQSQDRYICQTCNKAFSRPSSLRIHSHSHTGEKPFKCSQTGCGKAFSVRSNMKRHERGCHSVEVKPGGSML